jgi:hypothetical protein
MEESKKYNVKLLTANDLFEDTGREMAENR